MHDSGPGREVDEDDDDNGDKTEWTGGYPIYLYLYFAETGSNVGSMLMRAQLTGTWCICVYGRSRLQV